MVRTLLLITLALASTSPVLAAVLTVGPGGAHSTLQSALNVAVSNGEDDEIRIRQGLLLTSATATHAENHRLEISGGWAAGFGSGVSDATLSVLTGNQAARVLDLSVTDGEVLIRNLTLFGGLAPTGAGADLGVNGPGRLELSDCVVSSNTADSDVGPVMPPVFAAGGGVRLTVSTDGDAEISRCLFVNNVARPAAALGGGLALVSVDGSFLGNALEFVNNSAVGSGLAQGGAVLVDVGGADPSVEFTRLNVRNNRVDSDTAAVGAGMSILGAASTSGPFVTIEGAEFLRNRSDGTAPGAAQLELETSDGNFTLRSIAAVDGINATGLRIDATASAQVLVTNTTAAGNDIDGIRHEDGSSDTQAQYNAIAFGNGGADFVFGNDGNGASLSAGNLTATDPGVINAAAGNYRLATGSSAIDTCFPSPVGGLGTLDADFGARIVNGLVDCGAYEWSVDNEDRVFADGFETG